MSKLTVDLPEDRRRALKAAAAQRGITITQLVDESLQLNGVRTAAESWELLDRLRRNISLSEEEALACGVRVTRDIRAE